MAEAMLEKIQERRGQERHRDARADAEGTGNEDEGHDFQEREVLLRQAERECADPDEETER